ncbi:MAG: hypothetical protein ABL886_14420 [Rhodoglobus sp.]
MSARLLPCLFVGLTLVTLSHEARAQAWVDDPGALAFSLDYNYASSDKVIQDDGREFPKAGNTFHQVVIGGEWVPISRLAVSASVPLVGIKYTGLPSYVHPGGGSYDDGSTHWTLTDLRVGAHYQVLEAPFALSPSLAVSVPLMDYETVGNAIAGRHLKALRAGLAAGRQFGSFYTTAVYEFSLVEKYDRAPDTAKIGQNTSDGSLVLGYVLLQGRLNLNVAGNMHLTHGGVNFSKFNMLTPDQQRFHDPILRESIYLLGGGAAYQITPALNANLSARIFAGGSNTQNASVLALGVSWSVK